MQHGFDHYLCQIEQSTPRWELFRRRRLYRDGGTCLVRNDRQVGPDDPYYDRHLTDIIGDETVALIDRFHKEEKPFFINVWWLVPHQPYEPAPDPHWSGTAEAGISDDQHRFRSMVRHMDAKVGDIVAKLEELGILSDTLILFTSDNGAAYEGQIGDLRGGKTDLHEGGIRVPMFVHWPARISGGRSTKAIGHTNDILPTLCAATGVPLPEEVTFDGLNLFPHLQDLLPVTDEKRGTLFWQLNLFSHLQRHYPKPKPYATEAARRGRWKMLFRDGKPLGLFDLATDPAEETDLIDDRPDIAQMITRQLREFLAEPRNGRGIKVAHD